MKVTLKALTCEVFREPGDPLMRNDSQLLHHVKLRLKEQGHNVVKKAMFKDGHLVDESQFYVRQRRGKFAVYWSQDSIRPAYPDYNSGSVTLSVERDGS